LIKCKKFVVSFGLWMLTNSTRVDSLKLRIFDRLHRFSPTQKKKEKEKKRKKKWWVKLRQKLLHQAFPAFGTNNKSVVSRGDRRGKKGWNMTYFRHSPDWKYFRHPRVKLRRENVERETNTGRGWKTGRSVRRRCALLILCYNVNWRISI